MLQKDLDVLELWLIRHGETLWNREGRFQGQTDTALSELGVQQAERLAVRLRGARFDWVYASDLSRARDTARLALPGAVICLDERLRELHFGVFQGKTLSELTPDEKVAFEARKRDPDHVRPPGGESRLDVLARVRLWLEGLPASGRAVAFSHGGTIRAALFSVLGVPEGGTWGFAFGNTGITRFALGDRKLVLCVNDTAHLESAGLIVNDKRDDDARALADTPR